MTFEPRHENKSCSACPEDQLKLFKISNFRIFKNFQIFKFSKKFKFSNFLWFPAFVWLSDIFKQHTWTHQKYKSVIIRSRPHDCLNVRLLHNCTNVYKKIHYKKVHFVYKKDTPGVCHPLPFCQIWRRHDCHYVSKSICQ